MPGDLARALAAQQAAEAKQQEAEARLLELENALTWQTSCLACSRVLDSSIREHERAERAEASAKSWEEEARLRAINSGYWQRRAEAAEAALQERKEP